MIAAARPSLFSSFSLLLYASTAASRAALASANFVFSSSTVSSDLTARYLVPSEFLTTNLAPASLSLPASSVFTNFFPPTTTSGVVVSSGVGLSLSSLFLIVTWPASFFSAYTGLNPATRSEIVQLSPSSCFSPLNEPLKALVISKNQDGSKYSRWLYYENDNLMFAYYEGKDAQRLYFKDNKLIRWRRSPDAKKAAEAVNHDKEWENEQFVKWETKALNDSNTYQ